MLEGQTGIQPSSKNVYWYNENPQAYLIFLKELLSRMDPLDKAKRQSRWAIQQFIKVAEDLEMQLNTYQATHKLTDEAIKKELQSITQINQKLVSQHVSLDFEVKSNVDISGNLQFLFEKLYQNIYNPLVQRLKQADKNIKELSSLKILDKNQNYELEDQVKLLDRNILVMKLAKKQIFMEKLNASKEKQAVIETIANHFQSQESKILKFMKRNLQIKQNRLAKIDQHEQRINALEQKQSQLCSLMKLQSKRIDLYNQAIDFKNKLDNDSLISTEDERKELQEIVPIKTVEYLQNPQVILLKDQPKTSLWIALLVWFILVLTGGIVVLRS